ncbi:MAG TPA: hypothetical protein VMZ29_08305 [Candidatus Bathyarchaeia archaeon]|nr:hypothetical protein [Candidatus Bathyarchaeia archaeon]
MKLRKNPLLKIIKNRKAVSEILAAIMMIFMFIAAIGVVWAWLFPAYQRFQTTNTINSVNSYMLRVDETFYDIYGEGVGSTKAVRMDPSYGTFIYESGRNVSVRFSDAGTTFSDTYTLTDLGRFSYTLNNRRGVMINEGDHKYLKGPSTQKVFFVNGSADGVVYQGLTNLTLLRPAEKSMKMELEYRVRIYTWFDQTNNVLSITVNIIQIDIKATDFSFFSYNTLKINYNSSRTVYSTTTNVATDFYVDGSIDSQSFIPIERPLLFNKPSSVVNYDVNIEIVVNQFLLWVGG